MYADKIHHVENLWNYKWRGLNLDVGNGYLKNTKIENKSLFLKVNY